MFTPQSLTPSYLLVSSSAFLVYDYLLTVGLEIEFVWLSSFKWITPVYLLQRYLPFADTVGLFLYAVFAPTLPTQKCRIINHVGHWSHIVGTTLSEVVLTARTYAACQNRFSSRGLWATFIILAALFWIPVYFVTSETTPLGNISHIIPGLESGETTSSDNCTIHIQQPFFFLTYLCVAAYDTVILAMMIIAGYPDYKEKEYSQLFRVVYRDGIFYYVALIFVSLANVATIFTAPENFTSLLMPLSRVTYSILTSRTVLHIREVMTREIDDTGTLKLDE